MNRVKKINDFVLRFATAKGNGTIFACETLTAVLFRMGVYVSCRRIPQQREEILCHEIRINERGYLGQRGGSDFVLALTPENIVEEYQNLDSNGYFFYDSDIPLPEECERDDILPLGLPLTSLCKTCKNASPEDITTQIVLAIGSLAYFIDIPNEIISQSLSPQQNRSLLPIIQRGYEYTAAAYPQRTCLLSVRKSRAARNSILLSGSIGTVQGAIDGGADTIIYNDSDNQTTDKNTTFSSLTTKVLITDFTTSYAKKDRSKNPIPLSLIKNCESTQHVEALLAASKKHRRSLIVTNSNGLGIVTESITTAYFKEISTVIVNTQEPPNLIYNNHNDIVNIGSNMQGDILSCASNAFGDGKNILLFPCNPMECFTMTSLAFDIAEILKTPIFIMNERSIVENNYVCEPLSPNKHYYQKILGLQKRDGAKTQAINKQETLLLSDVLEERLTLLGAKHRQAQKLLPKPHAAFRDPNNQIGVLFYGSTTHPAYEAIGRFAAKGIKMNTMRIRTFPFLPEIIDFIRDHRRIFLIEQNHDAQMKRLIISETGIAADKIDSLLRYNGMPLTVRFIERQLARML